MEVYTLWPTQSLAPQEPQTLTTCPEDPSHVHPMTPVPPSALCQPLWCLLLFEALAQVSHQFLWTASGVGKAGMGTAILEMRTQAQRGEVTSPGFLCEGRAGYLAYNGEWEHKET